MRKGKVSLFGIFLQVWLLLPEARPQANSPDAEHSLADIRLRRVGDLGRRDERGPQPFSPAMLPGGWGSMFRPGLGCFSIVAFEQSAEPFPANDGSVPARHRPKPFCSAILPGGWGSMFQPGLCCLSMVAFEEATQPLLAD